jgi:sortase A
MFEQESMPSSHGRSRLMRRTGIAAAMTLGVAALLVPLKADDGLYVKAKTDLTQIVRQSAWKHALAGEHARTQWPWDDTVSAAGQTVPRLGLSAAVVKSDDGTAANDQAGLLQPPRLAASLDADPHLALPQVTVGDSITVTTADGLSQAFKVTGRQIDPARSELEAAPAIGKAPAGTCLSPNQTAAGELRLVIEAPQKNAEQKL